MTSYRRLLMLKLALCALALLSNVLANTEVIGVQVSSAGKHAVSELPVEAVLHSFAKTSASELNGTATGSFAIKLETDPGNYLLRFSWPASYPADIDLEWNEPFLMVKMDRSKYYSLPHSKPASKTVPWIVVLSPMLGGIVPVDLIPLFITLILSITASVYTARQLFWKRFPGPN